MNIQLFLLINKLAGSSKMLDWFMIFCARYLILTIPILILYFWFLRKKHRGYKSLALLITIIVTISLLFSWGISSLHYHPRPLAMHLGTALMHHPLDSSFPSDHAVAMFALAFTFWYLGKRKWGTFLFILATLVGGARVFCGVHFPFDIIGSFLVAWLVSGSIFYYYRKPNNKLSAYLEK